MALQRLAGTLFAAEATQRHHLWAVVVGVSAMVEIGYSMSSEEHAPLDLVKYAKIAEDVGFSFALISDHYHPWISRQGHSPFVWSVIGAIATATDRLRVGTGVTCPLMRMHPAIVAQAAATAAAMMPGRFFLGVGTGENLNEHVLGEGWPDADTRRAMLEEAIDVLRALWSGGEQSHFGRFFTVDNARLYTLPDEPPQVMVAAGTRATAELAGRLGDGLIGTAPDSDLVAAFEHAGGRRVLERRGATPRGHQAVRRRRIRPRLPSPGRSRSGGVLPLLRDHRPAAARLLTAAPAVRETRAARRR